MSVVTAAGKDAGTEWVRVDERYHSPGWQNRSDYKRARVYVHGHPAQEAEPTGPPCTDWDCDSYICRHDHAGRLMIALGMDPAREDGWTPVGKAEVDHSVWRSWMRRTTKQIRADLDSLVERGLMDDPGKLTFSRKAGCGCGCSPGFTGQTWGQEVFVTWTDDVAVATRK
jgi:hypothetical protein